MLFRDGVYLILLVFSFLCITSRVSILFVLFFSRRLSLVYTIYVSMSVTRITQFWIFSNCTALYIYYIYIYTYIHRVNRIWRKNCNSRTKICKSRISMCKKKKRNERLSCNVSSTTHRNVCFTHRFTVGFFDRVSVVHESSAQLNLYVTIWLYTQRERSSCRVEKLEHRQRTRSIREKKDVLRKKIKWPPKRAPRLVRT